MIISLVPNKHQVQNMACKHFKKLLKHSSEFLALFSEQAKNRLLYILYI